ncbi:hypothetical protein [Halioxenophilus aromaticivorans]|uniref:Phage ABA sandwich domain-containing protein n=1 Tax=Halioxenophilus aromaticivorans TaxID=1306992 RepID=A0AAV3U724_9ALTE
MNQALEYAKSINLEEIKFISMADYGQDSTQHLESLKKLIFEQDCVVNGDQYWFPYEVVELARWNCKDGHEKEFAICNIIIALSIIAGADSSNDPTYMIDTNASEYDKLTEPVRDLVLGVLIKAAKKS